jgi:hypothetical protein
MDDKLLRGAFVYLIAAFIGMLILIPLYKSMGAALALGLASICVFTYYRKQLLRKEI